MLLNMSKRSTTKIYDDAPPIKQSDIDSGKLILRQRKQGKLVPNKQRINIYLDQAIIAYFKDKAGERDYQTLINDSLLEAMQRSSIEATIRQMIKEELRNRKPAT